MTLAQYISGYPRPTTQAEWARYFGVSQPFLSQILSGARRPSFDVMLRIEAKTRGAVPVSSWAPAAVDDVA